MLYDTSDMDKGGPEDGDTAALAEGTQLCRTTQLRDMLHCLGGVAALLPLLSQLGEPLSLHRLLCLDAFMPCAALLPCLCAN